MQESMKYEFSVPTMDFTVAGEASSSIKKVLRQLGIDSGIIRRVAIATYEAEINIAIHSNGGKITCLISPEWVKVIAKDNGPGIENIELAMTKGFSTATSEIRELGFGAGMGLPNMKKCSDDFEITSEVDVFTQLVMTLYL
ncbi:MULTISPECIES: ATP-binding protein [unclassified Fusibacter]|uniref:ATP-binding protein n=1 Tax=unclassified Fusibacter TaxID=2624464 RepID=UPI0010118B4E|nr:MULTISPECIES: ATP-binding protein [unclassified Fusibacter]MCK8060583.1 ATP-binding protein [Fusibacter sp. A2]NPE22963.1 anti-sigma regulatory factor [Fusibacter sp. A1]RXV60028.1 anti-sigma regulatory factor [Fusibacter sp. A1]